MRGGGKFVSEEIVRNAVDTLYANIRFSDLDGDLRSIVVTSSVPNEGKSTVSILLAEAMAKSGMKTLLLECDLRRRSLAGMLNAHPDGAGLFAVLSGQVRLPEAVVNTPSAELAVPRCRAEHPHTGRPAGFRQVLAIASPRSNDPSITW